MARTLVSPQTFAGSYPVLPLTPGSADWTETANDGPTDLYCALLNGKTVIVAHNTDVGAQTITINSVPDSYNREGDITTYSIAAGKIARFGPFQTAGWANGGNLEFDLSSPLVRVAVLQLP